MEIINIVLSSLAVILLLIILVIVFIRKPQSNSGELTKIATELAESTKKLDERMIRVESEVDKLAPKINDEFRESRKEITENLRGNRKEISENLQTIQKTVDTRVKTLQDENTKKLEEMRETVDEKLKASVEKRFNESFKAISGQLTQVYQGLGEMKNLASGVGDLKKVMEGVKTRGIYGEVQLGSIITDTLNASQYAENVITKKGSTDRVEFAIKMPGKDEDATVFLPIDSKFPVENYSRLIAAYENGDKVEIEKFSKALASDVKEQAKKISSKYLDPPLTTDFGIMFVPTESLYAEILRIPGLSEELRQKYHVSLASPSTLPVALNGLLMGFKSVAIEKRSSEVWQVLGAVKSQFGKFGDLLDATHKKLIESANKIESAATTSRVIERKLKNVEALPDNDSTKLIGKLDIEK